MEIYIASKVKHAHRWVKLRAEGHNIISTWIDEAGQGESINLPDLAVRCIKEPSDADITILYSENGEILKGGLVEVGAALSAGKEVRQVGTCDSISRVFSQHPNWKLYPDLRSALIIQ